MQQAKEKNLLVCIRVHVLEHCRCAVSQEVVDCVYTFMKRFLLVLNSLSLKMFVSSTVKLGARAQRLMIPKIGCVKYLGVQNIIYVWLKHVDNMLN